MEAEVKEKKREKEKNAGHGGECGRKTERQDADERSEVSNGCEYIAVINFAKSRRRGKKMR